MIAVGAVALVAALVLAPRLMTTAIMLGAISFSLYSIAHVHGTALAVALILIVMLLLWILGLLRGFIRLGA